VRAAASRVGGDGGKGAAPPRALGAALLDFASSNFLPLGEFPLPRGRTCCLVV